MSADANRGPPARVSGLAMGAGCALAVLVALAYHEAPRNGFHFDDMPNIVDHAPVHAETSSWDALIDAGRHAAAWRRPLPSVTFAWDWWRGGGDPRAFQLTNVALHGLNTVLVFLLLLIVLRRVKGRLTNPQVVFAFLGAAAWGVHPIQVQAVTYIVQRMAEMALLFTVLALLAYLWGRLHSRYPLPWFVLCGVSFLLGAASKETAWVLPLLLVLAEYGVCRHKAALYRSAADAWLLALALLALGYLVADISFGGPFRAALEPEYAERGFTVEQRLLTQPRVIVLHLSQVLWPLPGRFSIEHEVALSNGLLNPPATSVAMTIIAIWCAVGLWLLLSPEWRHFGFFVLWVPATLVVESSVIPLEMVFEHRMYLPTVGLAGLAVCGLHAASEKRFAFSVAGVVAAGAFLSLCLVSTLQRVPVWRTDESLYEAAIPHAPGKARLWGNLGAIYATSGRPERALAALDRALGLDPENLLALEYVGVALMNLGLLAEAEAYFERLAELGADFDSVLSHRGRLAMLQGRPAEARLFFEAAAAKAPWVAAHHRNLALVLEHLGDGAAALGEWRRYHRLETDEAERLRVREHVAQTYGESLNDLAGDAPE